jgi:gamma-glutamylcyclotransferase (GGCT)/AIG2-like uncharacterized protein YtfP
MLLAMETYLFAYGTLRKACARLTTRPLLNRLALVGPATFPGRLYDLGSYPGAVFDGDSDSRVVGDVLQLPADGKTLHELDDYEGYLPNRPAESLFARELIPAKLSDRSERLCWVYLYQRDVAIAPLIASGDYAAWLAREKAI